MCRCTEELVLCHVPTCLLASLVSQNFFLLCSDNGTHLAEHPQEVRKQRLDIKFEPICAPCHCTSFSCYIIDWFLLCGLILALNYYGEHCRTAVGPLLASLLFAHGLRSCEGGPSKVDFHFCWADLSRDEKCSYIQVTGGCSLEHGSHHVQGLCPTN